MGKTSKNPADSPDRNGAAHSDRSRSEGHNGDSFREALQRPNERGNVHHNSNIGDHSVKNEQNLEPGQDFGRYLEGIEVFNSQIMTTQKAMEKVRTLSAQHVRDIQDAVKNREQVEYLMEQCNAYKTTIRNNFRDEMKKEADLKDTNAALKREQERAESEKKKLKDEREKLEKKKSAIEVEQKMKFQEQKKKLEKEQNERYEKLVKDHEQEAKSRQENDKKMILQQEAKIKKLSEELSGQKEKMARVEGDLKDAHAAKSFYVQQVESLNKDLKTAKNEFRLDAQTTEF